MKNVGLNNKQMKAFINAITREDYATMKQGAEDKSTWQKRLS